MLSHLAQTTKSYQVKRIAPHFLFRFQLDELREIIVQLETEQEGLTRRLLHKDRQLEELQESLNMTQQQLASKQHKLDRVRRLMRSLSDNLPSKRIVSIICGLQCQNKCNVYNSYHLYCHGSSLFT